jgi:hypothetical protein
MRTRRQNCVLRAFQADRTLHLPPLLLQFLQQVLDVRLGGPVHLGCPGLGGLVRAVGGNGGGRPGGVPGFGRALEEALGELVKVGVVGGVAAAEDEERVVATLQRKKYCILRKKYCILRKKFWFFIQEFPTLKRIEYKSYFWVLETIFLTALIVSTS